MSRTSTTTKPRQTVLGIDPGLGRMGYAVVSGTLTSPRLIEVGCIETGGPDQGRRLVQLTDALERVLVRHHPSVAAVEQLYFSVNVKTALQVAEARGVVMAQLTRAGMQVIELSPQAVKLAATGQGNADKRQVQKMLCLIFKLKSAPKPDDAADALAVALAGLGHYFRA